MKKVIEKKNWDYRLEKCTDEYFFSVVCGTVGIYEVTVTLSPAQVTQYENNGVDFLDSLAADIRRHGKLSAFGSDKI